MERMSLGKPSVTFVASENQKLISDWAHEIGGTFTLNPSDPHFESWLDQLIESLIFDEDQLVNMGITARKAVDGNGIVRVAQKITEENGVDPKDACNSRNWH
jgi:spore coat polysaccharide biosynthesis predicted glycosyltransferase SpsG